MSPAAKRRRRVKQEVFTAELFESQEEVEPKQEVEVDYYHSPSESQSSSVSVYDRASHNIPVKKFMTVIPG